MEYKYNNQVFECLSFIAHPCPTCGAPACGREDIYWNEKKECIVIDGSLFDHILGIISPSLNQEMLYLKDWFTDQGWTVTNSSKVNKNELMSVVKSLPELKGENYIEEYAIEVYSSFENLLKNTVQNYLYVTRT